MKKEKIEPMWKYVIYAVLLFWFFVLGVCGVAVFVFNASDNVMKWLVSLCSWTPTMTLFLMRKKLLGGKTLKEFYKNAVKDRISLIQLAGSMGLIIFIFLISNLILSIYNDMELSLLIIFVPNALFSSFFFTLIQGATGEESGWRGYLMGQMEGKYGFLKGNIILGLVWALWHLPLWFVSGSYSGFELIQYIIVFIIGLMSFSIIIAVFMRNKRNLLLAVWMHFWFNFVLSFFNGKDLQLLTIYAGLYSIAAIVCVLISNLKNKKINQRRFSEEALS